MIPTLAHSDASPPPKADPLAKLVGRSRGAWTLAALCTLAFLPTLFSPFFADDYFHIEHVARLREALTHGWILSIDTAGAWWTRPGLSVEYFRPLVVLSFAVDHFVYGDHAFGYHLTNLGLHVGTTWLLWGIARRVLGPGFAAWAAAALFAVHPAHTVAVSWISGRTDVLATIFYAAAFLLYLESLESHEPESRRRTSTLLLALSCASFAVALLAKEMAITLPAVVLAHGLLMPAAPGGLRGSIASRLLPPAAMGVVGASYLGLRIAMLGGFHAPPTPFAYHLGDPGVWTHLATAPLLYLADLVIFVPADPMATLPFWQVHPVLLAGFLAFILYTFFGTLKKIPNRRIAAWGLGWMTITILPVLMLTVGEHFLYLPSMGYCVLVASQLPASPADVDAARRRALTVVAGLVMLVCVVRTTMFAVFSRNASKAIDQAVAALDRAPNATRILVVDLPAAAALAFPHAVRLARPTRGVEVEMLSLVPRVFPDAEDLSVVTFEGPDRLDLRRGSGYLNSYLERALEGPPTPFRPGQTVTRGGYEVTITDADGGDLSSGAGPRGVGPSAARPSGAAPRALRAFSVRLMEPSTTLVLARTASGDLAPISPH